MFPQRSVAGCRRRCSRRCAGGSHVTAPALRRGAHVTAAHRRAGARAPGTTAATSAGVLGASARTSAASARVADSAGGRAQHAAGGVGTTADASAWGGARAGAGRRPHRRCAKCDGPEPRRCPEPAQPARASEATTATSAARSAGARRTRRSPPQRRRIEPRACRSGSGGERSEPPGKRSAQRPKGAEATGIAAEIGAKRSVPTRSVATVRAPLRERWRRARAAEPPRSAAPQAPGDAKACRAVAAHRSDRKKGRGPRRRTDATRDGAALRRRSGRRGCRA